nr:hypothetical protein [Tanacetum cinerariifolium]
MVAFSVIIAAKGLEVFKGLSVRLTAEFHGIYNGLLLLDKLGFRKPILESDCASAIRWIKQKDYSYHGIEGPKKTMIKMKNKVPSKKPYLRNFSTKIMHGLNENMHGMVGVIPMKDLSLKDRVAIMVAFSVIIAAKGLEVFKGLSVRLTAEFHGIYNGLLLLDKLGFRKPILESDCASAIRRLISKNRIVVDYCPRTANKCADKLANVATKKKELFVGIKTLPKEMNTVN